MVEFNGEATCGLTHGGNKSPCKEGARFEQFLQPAELQNMLRSLKIKNAEMGTLSLNFYDVIAMKPFVSRQSQISENNKPFAKLREMESPD